MRDAEIRARLRQLEDVTLDELEQHMEQHMEQHVRVLRKELGLTEEREQEG